MCGSHPLSIPSGKLGSIPNQRKSWPWQRPLDRLPPARVEPAHTGAEHPTQAKMRRMRACNAQWTLSSCPCRTPTLAPSSMSFRVSAASQRVHLPRRKDPTRLDGGLAPPRRIPCHILLGQAETHQGLVPVYVCFFVETSTACIDGPLAGQRHPYYNEICPRR